MLITNNDKQILKCFLALNIPAYIKTESQEGLDLMLCYEDLCNQVYNVIHDYPIKLDVNSWNDDDALIFDGRYEKILIKIVNETTDTELKLHCSLAITILQIIKKYNCSKN